MKRTAIIFFMLLTGFCTEAQKHDNIWIMGYYESLPHSDLGGIKFDFSQEPPLIEAAETNFNFRKTNSCVSNYEGEFQFATNGVHILNPEYYIMENGDSLNAFGITFNSYYDGINFNQASLILPIPDSDNKYYIFHQPIDWTPEITTHFPRLYYSLVDMEANGGLGTVIDKDALLIEDTLLGGKITATRHGNGRDWWLITGGGRPVYKCFLSDNGCTRHHCNQRKTNYRARYHFHS